MVALCPAIMSRSGACCALGYANEQYRQPGRIDAAAPAATRGRSRPVIASALLTIMLVSVRPFQPTALAGPDALPAEGGDMSSQVGFLSLGWSRFSGLYLCRPPEAGGAAQPVVAAADGLLRLLGVMRVDSGRAATRTPPSSRSWPSSSVAAVAIFLPLMPAPSRPSWHAPVS